MNSKHRSFAAAAALLLAPGHALAGNPHFIASQTDATVSGTTLRVSFKEAGLESGSVETIRVTADAATTFQCINGGGKNPSDPKKTTVDTTVTASGNFTAAKNGNVTGTLTLQAPSASEVGFSCPPGQQATLVSAEFDNVVIEDLTSGAQLFLGGPFVADL